MSEAAAVSSHATVVCLYPRLLGYVRRALAGLGVGAADLDDLAQDVFLTLHRRGCSFDSDREARSWLYGTARRVASNHRRARRRAERRAAHAAPPQAIPDPSTLLERADARAVVERFSSTLSPVARAAFHLSELEGMSGPDVAAHLGLPLNTTYSHIRRARTRLRRDWAKIMLATLGVVLLIVSMLAGRCAMEGGDDRPRVALHQRAHAAG